MEGRKLVIDSEGDVYSNLIHEELSTDAINKMQRMAKQFTTPDGLPLDPKMNLLLISPELESDAVKILGTNSKYRDKYLRAPEPFPEIQYMVLNLGCEGFAARQWAICDPTLMRELVKLVYITRPTVIQTALDNPLKDLYTGYVDFGCGWSDAHQIIFSNPK